MSIVTPPPTPSTLPSHPPSFVSSIFAVLFIPIKSNLYPPYVLGCVALHWAWMTAMGHSLQVNCLPLPPITYRSSYILSKGRSFMPTSPLCAGFGQAGACTGLMPRVSTAASSHKQLFCCIQKMLFLCSHPWTLPLSALFPISCNDLWPLAGSLFEGWESSSFPVPSRLCALCQLLHIEASLISSNGTAILVQGFVSSSCSCNIVFLKID